MWYMHANMHVHTDKLMHIIIIKKNPNSLETTGAREAFWMAAVRFGSLSTRHVYCLPWVGSVHSPGPNDSRSPSLCWWLALPQGFWLTTSRSHRTGSCPHAHSLVCLRLCTQRLPRQTLLIAFPGSARGLPETLLVLAGRKLQRCTHLLVLGSLVPVYQGASA